METNSLFIGSDPEFFVLNKNKPVSAISVLNCGKDERIDLGNNIKVFYDNVLLEMNINPSNSCAGLISSIQDALYRVAQHISPFVIEPIASMNFPESELKHPDARVFGCSPEFDAYEMCVVPPNHEATQLPFRSGGGHIHLGYSKEEFPLIAPIKDDDTTERDWGRIWVVRMMDLFVGIPALFVDHTYSDNLLMLTLSRGGPIVWLSEDDAHAIGVEDNDWIEAYNANGAIAARAVVSQRVKTGMAMMYHAQERIVNVPGSEVTGTRGGIHNSVTRVCPKPTHMIGGYAQLSYSFNYYGTVGSNRDEFVIVRKMHHVDWLDGEDNDSVQERVKV